MLPPVEPDAVRHARDVAEQELRIELMSAQLEQIRFSIDEARREGEERRAQAAERERRDSRRFWIQTIVTSLAGIAAVGAFLQRLVSGH